MIDLVRPSRGHTTQFFAARQVDGNPHAGEDYAYSNSSGEVFREVYAAAAGLVLFAGDSRGLGWPNILYLNIDFNRYDNVDESAGNYTIIQHRDAWGNVVAVTGYGHQEEVWVEAGQWVHQGQQIGVVGETGFSAGKHLHFDLVLDLSKVSHAPYYGRVDPKPYYTTSLAAQGTITPTTSQEDDDMAWSFEDKLFMQNEMERRRVASMAETEKLIGSAVWELKVFFQEDNENRELATRDSLKAKMDEIEAKLQEKLAKVAVGQGEIV